MQVLGAVVWRHMLGMCHSQSPHLVFNRVNVDMSCIYAGVLSLQIRMRWVIMATVNFSLLIVGLILSKPDCHPAPLLWCERDPTLPRCTSTFALPATRFDCYMMRPRGRPRRGAPWKPRRPSLSPPDTSSDDSPPRPQSVSSPVNLQPPHFGSMAIIPNTSITLLRLLHDPGPSQTPASNFGCGQAYQRRPSTPAPDSQASFDRAQFRDNLATLYTLVFELRQEVVDLHYRVEAMEIKVANFLQILASMHDALFPDSEEESAEGDPEVDGNDDQHPVTSPPGKSRDEEKHEDNAKEAERNQENDEHWSDGTAYIEEGPWSGDPPATWPSYQPGV